MHISRNALCASGVWQVLNKVIDDQHPTPLLTPADLDAAEACAPAVAFSLDSAAGLVRIQRALATEQRLRWRFQHYTDIALGILEGPLTMRNVCTAMMQRAQRLVSAERCTVFIVDAVKGELFSQSMSGTVMTEIRLPIGAGLAGHAAQHRETLCIPNVYMDPRFDQSWDRANGFRTRDMLVVPILHGREQQCCAVMQFINKKAASGTFDAADADTVQQFSPMASVLIQTVSQHLTQMEQAASGDATKPLVLLEIMRGLLDTADVFGQLKKSMAALKSLIGVEKITIYLIDPEAAAVALCSTESTGAYPARVPLDAGLVGSVFSQNCTVSVSRAHTGTFLPSLVSSWGVTVSSTWVVTHCTDARFVTIDQYGEAVPLPYYGDGYVRSALGVPLKGSHPDQVLGVIQLLNKTLASTGGTGASAMNSSPPAPAAGKARRGSIVAASGPLDLVTMGTVQFSGSDCECIESWALFAGLLLENASQQKLLASTAP